jgi:hypothetical protein
VWWNPAGLATVGIFDATYEVGRLSLNVDDGRPIDRNSAWRGGSFGLSLALPVVGFTFQRLETRDVRPVATAGSEPVRQDRSAVSVVRRLETQHVGVSLAQSLGDAVVAGATVRVVSGAIATALSASDATLDTALDAAGDLDTHGQTRVTADVGVLAFIGRLRLGLSARNLTAPRFADRAGGRFTLDRQVRLGAAYGGGAPAYQRRSWTAALDADLTDVDAVDGRRRALAIGGERWLAGERVSIRAGACMQTVDAARPEASGGVSVAIRSGMFVEGAISGGADRAAHGWRVAGRVTF